MSANLPPFLPSKSDLEALTPHLLAGLVVIGLTRTSVTVEDFGGAESSFQISIDGHIYVRPYLGECDGAPAVLWAVDAIRYTPATRQAPADAEVAVVEDGLRGAFPALRRVLQVVTDDILERAADTVAIGLDHIAHRRQTTRIGALAA
ncbi:hypothetical protein FHW79_006480 [Azospirillum sp. OGB3]|uniref:hypothetical protein n=1 Tax=Azospirillum sp. OGB3 TaxID=2587012 RepID=UPI0016064B91|nr:hypothetical protein [Azospirillum sp. OGB3]MBB3268804.1 hypothetical protein [Azospirillum sp. OGB3]